MLNRPTTASDGAGNPTIIGTSYDGLNRLTYRTDGNHNTSSYHFDNASRLLQLITTDSGNSNGLTTSYAYSNNTANPTQMADQSGSNPGITTTTSYAYDTFDRLQNVTSPQGIVSYGYDLLNRRSTLNFGSNTNSLNHVAYEYDGLSRPLFISNNYLGDQQGNRVTQQLGYAYTGERLSQLNYPNATKATFGYDGSARLTAVDHYLPSNSSFFSSNYTYDNLSNLQAAAETLNIPGTLTQHRNVGNLYDELSRLRSNFLVVNTATALTNHNFTYNYDPAGNRLSSVDHNIINSNGLSSVSDVTSSYRYDAANHATFGTVTNTVSDGTQTSYGSSYSYDGNGNLKHESVNYGNNNNVSTDYSYDVRNRLSGWTSQPSNQTVQSIGYGYDGASTRTGLTNSNGQNATYLQDVATGSLPLVLQQNSGSYSNYYLYAPGSTTPLFRSFNVGRGAGFWSHQDGLGSIRVESDYNIYPPTLTDVYPHNFDEPFGAGTTQPAANQPGDNYLYRGQQLDPNGLYYSQGHYYNPGTSRYVQPTIGGGNGYANDNPLNSLPQGPQCFGCGETLSLLLDFVPGVGQAKWLAQGVTGKDLITGADQSSLLERGLNIGRCFHCSNHTDYSLSRVFA